ncbi:MAG: hypothetical protein SOW12_00365 [Lachnospiraceae bacterium]|nr:hypothetical protein [Lachnoclostridium sp.]MDD7522410.1 hypothetical protein [Lachnoclostridium sp.]MDY2598385.1 hypothetical protein [Lachnospiraceae bacterium]
MTILKTHRKKRMKRSLSLVLALAMTVTGLPGGLHSTGRAKAAEEIGKPAELTFDDANDPLLAGNAKAEAPNGYSLIERNGGKALSLSDSQNQYIALTGSRKRSILLALWKKNMDIFLAMWQVIMTEQEVFIWHTAGMVKHLRHLMVIQEFCLQKMIHQTAIKTLAQASGSREQAL